MKILGQGAEKLHTPYILVSDVPDNRKAKKKKIASSNSFLLFTRNFLYQQKKKKTCTNRNC